MVQVRNRFETLKQKKYQSEEPDYVPDGEAPPLRPSCDSTPSWAGASPAAALVGPHTYLSPQFTCIAFFVRHATTREREI